MGVEVALVVLGVLLATALLVLALYCSRQRTLSRRIGSFGCYLAGVPGRAQYAKGRLVWWRTLSLAPRPAEVWMRGDLVIEGSEPLGSEDGSGRPLMRARCRHGDRSLDLTMSAAAYSGLVSWLESAPRAAGRVV